MSIIDNETVKNLVELSNQLCLSTYISYFRENFVYIIQSIENLNIEKINPLEIEQKNTMESKPSIVRRGIPIFAAKYLKNYPHLYKARKEKLSEKKIGSSFVYTPVAAIEFSHKKPSLFIYDMCKTILSTSSFPEVFDQLNRNVQHEKFQRYQPIFSLYQQKYFYRAVLISKIVG